MALSASALRTLRSRGGAAFDIATAEVVYGGSYGALRSLSHATAASRGQMDVFVSANGNIPVGFIQRGATGDTSATPIVEGEMDLDNGILFKESVAGGVGDATDNGQWVYLSDDDTFTFTRPTLGLAVGVAVRYHSSTNYDVLLFTFAEMCVIALSGSGQDNVYLGSIDLAVVNPNEPGGAQINLRTGWPCPYHGKITDIFAIVDVATVATSGTDGYIISLELGGTNLTGGALSVAGANAIGAKISLSSAQAITAANVMHEGDLLDVEVVANASGDVLTAGRIDLWMQVEKLAGL